MNSEFHLNPNADFAVCKEDFDHHNKVLGPTSKGDDTSPVGMVKRGLYPITYLDKFTSESQYFDRIQAFKAN